MSDCYACGWRAMSFFSAAAGEAVQCKGCGRVWRREGELARPGCGSEAVKLIDLPLSEGVNQRNTIAEKRSRNGGTYPMACKRKSREVYVWSVLALMVVALPLIIWALIQQFAVWLYRCELSGDEGLLIVKHYLCGRLVLEELWDGDDTAHLWGITLFDWLTLGAGRLMTTSDTVRVKGRSQVIDPIYKLITKAALFGKEKRNGQVSTA